MPGSARVPTSIQSKDGRSVQQHCARKWTWWLSGPCTWRTAIWKEETRGYNLLASLPSPVDPPASSFPGFLAIAPFQASYTYARKAPPLGPFRVNLGFGQYCITATSVLATMAATGEKVWGLHKFTAENADEVSFDVGETILVVEKDDMYGDGWWQVSNPFSEPTLALCLSDSHH